MMQPLTVAQYVKILENVGDVVVIGDENGIIRYKSSNSERLFGWSPDELVGKNAWEHIHPDDQGALKRFMATIVTEPGTPGTHEVRYRCKDGDFKWISFTVVNLLDDPDVRGILGHYHDITKRKQAETEMIASNELLTNLARLVPGVIYQYRLDPDGHSAFPYSSPGMEDIYEVTPEEVREDASPVFSRLHPDDSDEVSRRIVESARTLGHFTVEFRVVLPRQGLRWRWSQAVPERTPDGGILWHGIITDITERKNAELERDRLQGELTQAQKMESIGRLAGGVAHDFNNMLGVITGYTEMMLDELPVKNPYAAGLLEIQKAAERSIGLTRQLLAFARRQTITPQSLNLNDIISEMLSMIARLIGEDISLQWKPGQNLWDVRVDPSQIDQVLANLCVNAKDAIGGVGTVTIATENQQIDDVFCANRKDVSPGDYVRLSVSDTGVGMDDTVLEHLFEPFFTTKPMGKGTGLGLSTIYGITKQNKGFLDVVSTIGNGATFSVFLRRDDGDESAEAIGPLEAPVYVEDATILVVEDEPSLLRVAVNMLEKSGYTVIAVDTPARAIAAAESYTEEIHLLLTDVIMPEMNGRYLAEKVQSLRPRIRVLFMSGYTADIIAPHGVLDQGVMFLPKPFSKQTLRDKVKEALGVRLRV